MCGQTLLFIVIANCAIGPKNLVLFTSLSSWPITGTETQFGSVDWLYGDAGGPLEPWEKHTAAAGNIITIMASGCFATITQLYTAAGHSLCTALLSVAPAVTNPLQHLAQRTTPLSTAFVARSRNKQAAREAATICPRPCKLTFEPLTF